MTFSHTLSTELSPAVIWAIWTAVDRWPTWDSELKSARLDGEFCLGATGQLTPNRGPALRFEISALELDKSYTFTTRLLLCRLHVRRFLTFDDELRFTHEVSFEGPLAFLFSWLLGRQFRRVLPDVMRSLLQIAEQQTNQQSAGGPRY